MTKYFISAIGTKANKNVQDYDFDKWIDRTVKYIKIYIDKEFDEKKFGEWLMGDGEEPFIFGKNRFYW